MEIIRNRCNLMILVDYFQSYFYLWLTGLKTYF